MVSDTDILRFRDHNILPSMQPSHCTSDMKWLKDRLGTSRLHRISRWSTLIKKGITIGSTDDFGYNIKERPVHVHDFQATLMHLLGIDHERLTFKHQGRRYRLTDVHGEIVKEILS